MGKRRSIRNGKEKEYRKWEREGQYRRLVYYFLHTLTSLIHYSITVSHVSNPLTSIHILKWNAKYGLFVSHLHYFCTHVLGMAKNSQFKKERVQQTTEKITY